MKRFVGLLGIFVCAAAVQGADVKELIKQLQDGNSDERRTAATALGEGGAQSKAAVPALIKALKDRDTFVRRFSARALGEIGSDASSAVPALTAALSDPRKEVQTAAARALAKVGPSGVTTLIDVIRDDDKDSTTRRHAIDSLSRMGSAAHAAVPALTELVKEPGGKSKKKMAPEDLRIDAANALGALATAADKDTIEALEALTDKKAKAPRGLKQAANQSLRKIKQKK